MKRGEETLEGVRNIRALADRMKAKEVAQYVEVCEATVHYQHQQFNEAGAPRLDDLPGIN